jgi:hypothetical protein
MSESKDEQIARLLRAGLDYFGDGDDVQAVDSWRQVLELDPGNAEARDFLADAPRSGPAKEILEALETAQSVIGDARGLVRGDQLEGALELMQSGSVEAGSNLEIEALIELARVELVKRYRDRLGDMASVPVVQGDPKRLTQFNLPANAGFLLSLLDGSTAVADLITLSGMDAFDALRTIVGLVDAGIVELRA